MDALRRGAGAAFLQQREPVGRTDAETAEAHRALTGACILGLLGHYGRRDHEKAGTVLSQDVTLFDLRRVATRQDTGLHGCAFEYAMHETINNAPGLPESYRTLVQAVVNNEIGRLHERHSVPTSSLSGGLRSVLYGVEKDTLARSGALESLGAGALMFADGVPYALSEHLPNVHCPSFSNPRSTQRPGPRTGDERFVQEGIDPALGRLWQTDLFLGGHHLERTAAVSAVTDDPWPTAWVPTSLKFPARVGTGGAGLQLVIETSARQGQQSADLVAKRMLRGDTPVLVLPLRGEFLVAFTSAFRTLLGALRANLPRTANASKFGPEEESLVLELSTLRTAPAIEVGHALLAGRPGLVSVTPAADGRRTGLRRVLVPVPQADESLVA